MALRRPCVKLYITTSVMLLKRCKGILSYGFMDIKATYARPILTQERETIKPVTSVKQTLKKEQAGKYLQLNSWYISLSTRIFPSKIKVLCEQTREVKKLVKRFFGLWLILSGLGNIVVDFHFQSTRSSLVFTRNVPKKKGNSWIRWHYN